MGAAAPVGPLRKAAWAAAWALGRVLFALWFRLEVQNRPRPFPRGPLVVAANHCSFLDPLVLSAAVPRRIVFLVTSEMYYRPWLRPFMWLFGCIPVDPARRNRDALRAAFGALGRGEVVGIFPEGGISRDGRLRAGQAGVATLLRKSGAPALPVALLGTYAALARRHRFPRPVKVRVHFGPLIRAHGAPPEAAPAEVRDALRDHVMAEIAARLPPSQQPAAAPAASLEERD